MRTVYADNAATTKIHPQVLSAMTPHLTGEYGNPSSQHSSGIIARRAVETARRQVSGAINAGEDEIYFTSGGTEADNWALLNTAVAYGDKGKHIITSGIEHHAVLEALHMLECSGFEITRLDVDGNGLVSTDELEMAIRRDTILITVMFANNETGVIQPIADIGRIARERGVLFHTDAVQAAGQEAIDVQAMNIDMLSLSGHKLYGPKGTGALYVREGVELSGILYGGGQERGKRAGTENVPGIVGLGAAMERAALGMDTERFRLAALRDKLVDGILAAVPDCRLNGDRNRRLAGFAHFTFGGIDGEMLAMFLNLRGVAVSTGPACTSGSLEPSHVLTAMGLPGETARGALRITLGAFNSDRDVDYILNMLPEAVSRLRKLLPVV